MTIEQILTRIEHTLEERKHEQKLDNKNKRAT
jgi:hypothetical protein